MGGDAQHLTDALLLFERLEVDIPALSEKEITLAHFGVTKRHHPDHGTRNGDELTANTNAASTIILKAHFHSD